MIRIIRLAVSVFFLIIASLMIFEANAATPDAVVIKADGIINPVMANYIDRGIRHAEDTGADICIIQLDTPGGLDTSMRDIVQDIVSSRVPVVVYVSPSGARAASAGVFITRAGHVAAMAPNTAIGAASPVSIGPEGEEQMSETMQDKVMNDAAAYIRSIAEAHGRNMEWAEKAVREAVSATEKEALELNVIDLVSPDIKTLLSELDGREVTMLGGATITLTTLDASVDNFDMSWIESLLFTISDPNIAYILLSLGSLGIMAEIFNPGLIFPGVIGAISLLLAFFSLGMLPVNWAGIALIILAIAFFIAEVFTASFGLLTAGGVVSLVIGSLMLFQGASPVFRIDPWLIAVVAIIFAGFFAFVVNRVILTQRRRAKTGREDLVGKTATVKTPLDPEGTIVYKGELWTAIADKGKFKAGEEVTITGMDGLILYVTRKSPSVKLK